MRKKQAIFLDRDGTIMVDVGYPNRAEQVELLPGVADALKTFRDHGYMIIVVSNQSGVGRGYMTPDDVSIVHQRLLSLLSESGVSLDEAYYCPHAPEENCDCRKPSPAMIFDAAKKFDIDLSRSFMIGDREVDIETGKRAGCKTVHLKMSAIRESGAVAPDYEGHNWNEVAALIMSEMS